MRKLRQRRPGHPELVRRHAAGGHDPKGRKGLQRASNGQYDIDVQLLPTDASQQREQLVRRLAAKDSTVDLIGMDVIWTAEFANAGWITPFPKAERQ